MKITMSVLLPLPVASIMVLLGCASAPKEEMDQANQTAMLISSFETEAKEFKTTQARLANERISSIKFLRSKQETYQADDKFDDRAAKLAGQDAKAKLVSDLKGLADGRTQDAKDLEKTLADLDAKFATVVAPLPEIAPQLEAAYKQFAVLGSNLSTAEQIKVTVNFVKYVKEAVEKNKAQIAATSTSQPATVTNP